MRKLEQGLDFAGAAAKYSAQGLGRVLRQEGGTLEEEPGLELGPVEPELASESVPRHY